MGHELQCGAVVDGVADFGRALLENDHVLFRGTARVKLMYAQITTIESVNGVLTLRNGGHTLALELGAQVDRWADKIRHPKSLLDKLGVKRDRAVALVGVPDGAFRAQLAAAGVPTAASPMEAHLTFLQVDTAADLSPIAELAAQVRDDGALWVVAPKGRADIKDTDVIRTGRSAGLVDIKVCSFSVTHTALKFVRGK